MQMGSVKVVHFTLKTLAEMGHIMGLPTIGEAYTHVTLHYDAYFILNGTLQDEFKAFDELVSGHEDELVTAHLTPAEIKKLDDDLEEVLSGN